MRVDLVWLPAPVHLAICSSHCRIRTRYVATVMHRLTTGISYEKCVVRRFRRGANVIECTYTKLAIWYSQSIAPRLQTCTFVTQWYYNINNLMGPPSYMRSVEDLNVFRRRMAIRGLLEKYPTFGREKETGLLGALDT